MITRILVGIIFLVIAIFTPFYFEPILFFSVANIGIGWVITTILIRLIVIIFLFISLRQLFNLSPRLRKIKSWLVFVIALLPGFGISFIAPIYTTDYGIMNDELKLEDEVFFTEILPAAERPQNGYMLCAFFTTSCPHCMAAAERLGANIEAGQTIPVWTFFPGNKVDTDNFLAKHNGQKFNTKLFTSDSLFMACAGNAFPSIFLINAKNETEYHWTGDEMNYSALDYLKRLE